MAITQSIISNQTTACGNLTVQDQSTYGSAAPDERDDFGLALFVNVSTGGPTYTPDPTLSDVSNPGDAVVPASWAIDIPNSSTQDYEIIVYWAPLWLVGNAPFTTGDIVYYEVAGTTGFWINTAAGDGSQTPGLVSTHWTQVDATNAAEFAAATNLLSSTTYENVVGCPEWRILFKECDGVHRLIDNSENSNAKRYTITSVDGTEIVAATTFTPPSGENYVDITFDQGDDVYIVTVEENDGGWTQVAQLVVYEYCALKTCFVYLITSIQCNEVDPCCDNCDEETILKHQRQRLNINQVIALYGMLLAYINEESNEYLGVIEIDATRLTYLENIENIIDKIKDILERCELCAGAWQETVPTTSNSYKPCNC